MRRIGIALALLLVGMVHHGMAQDSQTVFSCDFEGEAPNAYTNAHVSGPAALTTDPADVIAGAQSLKADTTNTKSEWHEYFRIPPGVFRANEAYVVRFDYLVLARGAKTRFQSIIRSKEEPGRDQIWIDLPAEPGAKAQIETTVWTGDIDDYEFSLGVHWQGAIVIDNIQITADPAARVTETHLPDPDRPHTSPGNTTYHVDADAGDDEALGTSPQAAWRTLGRVNATTFAAGDTILLNRGDTWTDVLAPGGSGAEGAPIRIDAYGEGPRPIIAAPDTARVAVYIHNQEYWEVSGLEITNKGKVPGAQRYGVLVTLSDYGTAHHIHLTDLYVHDVNGSNVKHRGKCGIQCTGWGGTTPTRFDDLLIENCHLVRTDRHGIRTGGSWRRDEWFPHLNVVIRGNLLEDIGGDGIMPMGCDGALVEHNVVRGARMRAHDAAAGIWPWTSDNTVIQFNEVSGVKGSLDGQGFDSDCNCRNTIIQYNYSHDNEGGFVLLCNNASDGPSSSVGNVGTIVRYNISQNDGIGSARVFHIAGGMKQTQVYNNTIYLGPDQDLPMLLFTPWGGWADDTVFRNNLFVADGRAQYEYGSSTNNAFEGNLFHGNHASPPEPIGTDPLLVDPGSGGDGIESLSGYKLRPESPCRKGGVAIADNGGRDFWGNPLPDDGPLDVGAHQATPVSRR